MTPIDIQVSRSKVKIKGHAFSLYVGEGGHYCFTNIYIFPKRPSGAPLHALSKLYDVPDVFVFPSFLLRQCIAIFAVAEGWLLLDIG